MAAHLDLLKDSPSRSHPNTKLSPARILAVLMALIFLAEVISMVIIRQLVLPNYAVQTLLDGIIMLVLILPGLYSLQLRPLLKEINERTRAESALRNSEEMLRRVLELLPVGVWITDENGKIVLGNPASQAIWAGVRYVDMEHYSEYKAYWADSGKPIQPEEWAGARAILRAETALNEEVEIEGFDGSHKIILNSAVPILDAHRAVQGAIIVNQDITRRRQQEKALIQKNELLERFFSSINTLIAYMDRDFNFIRVNDSYAQSGGHPPDFYIGKNHFDLFPNEENQTIFRSVVESGQAYSVREKPFEYAEFPERGVTYWDWNLQPVKDVTGEVEGLVLSLVDVTARKRADIQIARQNQELLQMTDAERRQRRLSEGLVQATIAINNSLELDRVLCSILEQIRIAIPFQGGDILLMEGKTFRVAGFLGFEDYPQSLPAMERSYRLENYPLLQEMCSSLQPVMIQSVKEGPNRRMVPGLEWLCSYAGVPLVFNGSVIGIVEIMSEVPAAFTQEEMDQFIAFAAPAALALQNAQIYKAELTARRIAETLSAAAQSLTQSLNLEQVMDALLDHIQGIIHPDFAGVTLLEDEAHLSLRAMRGYGRWADRENIPSFPIEGITDSVLRRLALTHKSLTIPNHITGSNDEARHGLEEIHEWLLMPIIANEKVIGLVELGKAGAEPFVREQIQWAEALVGQAAVAIQNAWLFDQIRSSSDRVHSLARKLVEVQENERYHIARELHDEAGQSLASLKIRLGRLEQDPGFPQHLRQQVLDLKGLTDGVLENLHRLAMDLRPASLDHLGLAAALEQVANNLSSAQLSIRFKAVGLEGKRISSVVETTLYRIVQEALTNVIRHSQATSVGILLERRKDKLRLFIEDDGIGFDPDRIDRGERLGLVGMRERAEMLGGRLSVESTPSVGTSIIVEVPDVD